MPKSVFYRANAIIYFEGDSADFIPVLKDGHVELTYRDLQSGVTMRDSVKTGEFFGVKANIGRYSHDDTAMALTDCTIVQFTPGEFESMAANNPRVLLKLLQVLSNQLRRIHNEVNTLLSSDQVSVNPEAGLVAIGDYYSKQGQYKQAIRAYTSYLKHWPRGIYAPQVTLKADEAQAEVARQSQVNNGDDDDYSTISYSELLNYYKLGHFNDALKGFWEILKEGREASRHPDIEFYLGFCLNKMNRYRESARQLTKAIRAWPEHNLVGEAVYTMGLNHKDLGNSDKARNFMRKATQMVTPDNPLYRKAKEQSRILGESGS